MAAPVGQTDTPHTIAVSAGPEALVLLKSTNIDVDGNLDFNVIGPCDAIEVVIKSATAKTGTPSVVFNLQGYDTASNSYITLVSSAALTDAGDTYLLVSHHAAAVTNHTVGRIVREKLRLNVDYTGTPVTDVLNGVTVTVQASTP